MPRRGLVRLLNAAGYETRDFASADELLRDLDAGGLTFGCLILDARSPGKPLGGFRGELATRGMKVPCIVVTADDSDETRHMAREMNAAGFFCKPVDGMALLDAIRWAVPEATSAPRPERTDPPPQAAERPLTPDRHPSNVAPKPGTQEGGTRMKTTNLRLSWVMLAAGILANTVQADVLELKNGTLLNGSFAGGTAGTVRFETAAGVQVIERSQIVALKRGESITIRPGTLIQFTLTQPCTLTAGG